MSMQQQQQQILHAHSSVSVYLLAASPLSLQQRGRSSPPRPNIFHLAIFSDIKRHSFVYIVISVANKLVFIFPSM